MILLDNLMAGLNGGGYWEEGGGVGTSSRRFNASLLVGGLVSVKASSMVSPGETSGSFINGERNWRGLHHTLSVPNCHCNIFPGIICPGNICLYQE